MKERFLGGLMVFLGAASFGVLSSIVKTAYGLDYTVGQVTGVQTLFGMVILWLLYLCFKKKAPKITNAQDSAIERTWPVVLIGVFPGLVGIFYYQSVQLVPASVAIILIMQYLWISVIIDVMYFKNKASALQIFAVVLIIIGSCLAAGLLNQGITINLMGYLFGFLAAITYSLFIITSSKVGVKLPKLQKSALMITGACAVTFIFFPPVFLFQLSVDDKIYQLGFLLALMGTVIPPLLFSIGMPKIGISLGAILSAVELPVAVLAAYFYLHESVYLDQWLGVILILIAIVLPNVKSIIRKRAVD